MEIQVGAEVGRGTGGVVYKCKWRGLECAGKVLCNSSSESIEYHDMINDQVAFGGGCVMEHYARLYEIVPSLAEKIFTGEGPLDYARVGFSRPNPEMYTSTNLALANVAVKCSDDLMPYVLVAPRGGKVGRRRRAKRRRP